MCRRDELEESAQGIEADDIFGVLFGDGVNEVVNIFLCFDGRTERMLHLEGERINVFLSNLYSSPGHVAKLVHVSLVLVIILSWAYVGL